MISASLDPMILHCIEIAGVNWEAWTLITASLQGAAPFACPRPSPSQQCHRFFLGVYALHQHQILRCHHSLELCIFNSFNLPPINHSLPTFNHFQCCPQKFLQDDDTHQVPSLLIDGRSLPALRNCLKSGKEREDQV